MKSDGVGMKPKGRTALESRGGIGGRDINLWSWDFLILENDKEERKCAGRWGRAFDDVGRTVGECDISEEKVGTRTHGKCYPGVKLYKV